MTTITAACGNRTSEQLNENSVVCDVVLLQNPTFQSCRDRDIDANPFANACKVDMCKCEVRCLLVEYISATTYPGDYELIKIVTP